MATDEDDGSIPSEADLLRRIDHRQIVSGRDGHPRPSSAAFKDPNLSVDVELRLHAANLDWHFTLKDHPGFSLVRFPASAAREKGLLVVSKPLPDNPAHAEVIGKKTQGIANWLRDHSEWIHIVGTNTVGG